MSRENASGVQSVVRALSLLNVIADCPTECSLSEISRRAKLPSSTAHRLLSSLAQAGYVSQDPDTAKYALGANLIRLSQKAVQKNNLIKIARPWLEEMAVRTGETVNLTARFDDSVIQLDHVDSTNMLRVSYSAGERFPMHASASGKLFLAFMPTDECQQVMRSTLPVYTNATVTRRPDLEAEIRLIRDQGYAIDDAEREMGVRCVAAPIRNSRGEVAAAISISAPSTRVSVAQLHELGVVLTGTANAVAEAWENSRWHIPGDP